MDTLRAANHKELDQLQRARADLFLALHSLTVSTSPREFADCLADVATLNAQHGTASDEESAAWQALAEALQEYLDQLSAEKHSGAGDP